MPTREELHHKVDQLSDDEVTRADVVVRPPRKTAGQSSKADTSADEQSAIDSGGGPNLFGDWPPSAGGPARSG